MAVSPRQFKQQTMEPVVDSRVSCRGRASTCKINRARFALEPVLEPSGAMNPSSDRPTSRATPFFDVRMRGFRDRAEVADVVALLAARLQPLPSEDTELREAAGRVLAENVVSEVDVPSF